MHTQRVGVGNKRQRKAASAGNGAIAVVNDKLLRGNVLSTCFWEHSQHFNDAIENRSRFSDDSYEMHYWESWLRVQSRYKLQNPYACRSSHIEQEARRYKSHRSCHLRPSYWLNQLNRENAGHIAEETKPGTMVWIG